MKPAGSYVIIAAVLALLVSCQGGRTAVSASEGDTLQLRYAENLLLEEHEGYLRAVLRNPWDTAAVLQTYLLVPKEQPVPENLPTGVVIRVPLERALVYSSVHCSLISQLGSGDRIGGVCDPQYIHLPALQDRLKNGTLQNCGNSMSPDLERIVEMHPDAILLSPYENSNGYGKLAKLGIPIVECADYMETSALGRAEWMRFYGLLFGNGERSDSLFGQVEMRYLALQEQAKAASSRPRVLSDMRYGQVWYVPGAYSTTGRLYEDAGAENPFAYLQKSGSVPLSAEQVFDQAYNASVWLIKYNQPEDKTLTQLKGEDPVYARFEAFQTGEVYGCNTHDSRYYEETPYHPDLLLSDLIHIFHPELKREGELRYFHRMKP